MVERNGRSWKTVLRWLGLTGLVSAPLACGPRRPDVPPVPAPLIGSCYLLAFAPHPPPLPDWSPSDTIRFLSSRYAESIDTGQETNGHLARGPAEPGEPRQADWWITQGQIHLAFRTLAGERLLEFDSLTPPAKGTWRQSGPAGVLRGTVGAELADCGKSSRH